VDDSTTTTSQSTSIRTLTKTSTSQMRTQTPTSHAKKSYPNIGTIVGVVVGAIVCFVPICVFAFAIATRSHRTRTQLMNSALSGAAERPAFPAFQGTSVHGSLNTSPRTGSPVSGTVDESTVGAAGTGDMGVPPPTPQLYMTSPDTSVPDNNNPPSFRPPTLPSMIEQTSLQKLPSSNSRGAGSSSLYPAGAASYAATLRAPPGILQASASHETPFSSPMPGTENPPEVESGYGGRYPQPRRQ